MTSLHRFTADTSGATSIEYGLIAGLIALVIISVLTTVGTRLNTKLGRVSTGLS